jgi:hypothetical protein
MAKCSMPSGAVDMPNHAATRLIASRKPLFHISSTATHAAPRQDTIKAGSTNRK